MSKVKAITQILLGLCLAYVGVPSQSQLLVYVCQQASNVSWISIPMDICLLFKYVLSALGILSLIFGIIKLVSPEKKKKSD